RREGWLRSLCSGLVEKLDVGQSTNELGKRNNGVNRVSVYYRPRWLGRFGWKAKVRSTTSSPEGTSGKRSSATTRTGRSICAGLASAGSATNSAFWPSA